MSESRYLVTVTDNLSATSMPFNEFVLYRHNHYPEEKQIIILLFKNAPDNSVLIPNDIEVCCVGTNIRALREYIKKISIKAKQDNASLIFHIHEAKSVLLFNVATCFKYKPQIIFTLHSTYKNYPFHNKLFCACASLMVRVVVCVSKTSLKYYPQILKRIKGDYVKSIQNGVDTDRIITAGKGAPKERNRFTMIYVARLVPLKRHYILLEALKQIPDVQLILIGQGQLREELEDKVRNYGLESRVSFKGLMPREEVYRQLKSADLYVSTSSYEGLPIGVLEAMGCGIVCLVTNIEQHEEIAEECPSLITISDKVEDWVDAIKMILAYDEKRVAEICTANKNDVFEKFSLRHMHINYDKVYYLCSNNK